MAILHSLLVFFHIAEALPNQKLFDIHEGKWHRLDNIGCISAFNMLAIYLLDIGESNAKLRAFLEHFQFGIVMILQEWKPWDMRVTLFPIVVFNSLIVIKYVVLRRPIRWRLDKLKMSSISLIPAVYCFYRGLDDARDYLRMWHGMWHCLIGISMYWLWQVIPIAPHHEKKTKKIAPHKQQSICVPCCDIDSVDSIDNDALKVG